jgi:hypothetical protein
MTSPRFPARGSIAGVEPFGSIATAQLPGFDQGAIADQFRAHCSNANISLADPSIAERFQRFCELRQVVAPKVKPDPEGSGWNMMPREFRRPALRS